MDNIENENNELGAIILYSNGFKDEKPIFSIDSNFDSKHINNLAPNTPIPDSLIETINKGITLEQLDEVAHLPICHYKTQITIHGVCDKIKSNKVYGYAALVINSNKSLGVRWLAIDLHKKGRIADYVGCYDWRTYRDSQVYCYVRRFKYTKDNKDEVYNRVIQFVKSIDQSLFYGYIDVLQHEYRFSADYDFEVVIYLQGIYEKNIRSFLEQVCADNWENIEKAHAEFEQRMEEARKEREKEEEARKERAKKAKEEYEQWVKDNPFDDKFQKIEFADLQSGDIIGYYKQTSEGGGKYYYELYLNYKRLCYRSCDENGVPPYKSGHVLERKDLPDEFWVWRRNADRSTTQSTRPERGSNIEILDYRTDEVVVLGYTKHVYHELKDLGGGKWDKYINIEGRPMAQGWRFPRSKRADLERILGVTAKQPENEPEPQPAVEPEYNVGEWVWIKHNTQGKIRGLVDDVKIENDKVYYKLNITKPDFISQSEIIGKAEAPKTDEAEKEYLEKMSKRIDEILLSYGATKKGYDKALDYIYENGGSGKKWCEEKWPHGWDDDTFKLWCVDRFNEISKDEPYKVGDKVMYRGKVHTIEEIDRNAVIPKAVLNTFGVSWIKEEVSFDQLKPYIDPEAADRGYRLHKAKAKAAELYAYAQKWNTENETPHKILTTSDVAYLKDSCGYKDKDMEQIEDVAKSATYRLAQMPETEDDIEKFERIAKNVSLNEACKYVDRKEIIGGIARLAFHGWSGSVFRGNSKYTLELYMPKSYWFNGVDGIKCSKSGIMETLNGAETEQERKIAQFIMEIGTRDLNDEENDFYDAFIETDSMRTIQITDLLGLFNILKIVTNNPEYGSRHILVKHFGVKKDYVTADEIVKMGEIIRSVEPQFAQNRQKHPNRRVYEKTQNGVLFKVVIDVKDKKGVLVSFYSDRV